MAIITSIISQYKVEVPSTPEWAGLDTDSLRAKLLDYDAAFVVRSVQSQGSMKKDCHLKTILQSQARSTRLQAPNLRLETNGLVHIYPNGHEQVYTQ